jgi:hypothetical protein
MRTEQDFTPKYWVLHDPESDDVYLDTASKVYNTCANLAFTLHDYDTSNPNLCISLVEIKLVEFK